MVAVGGVYCDEVSVVIRNCVVTGNQAYFGGGMFNYTSSPPVTDCEFTDNEAVYWGGGMYIYASSSIAIKNCEFWSNEAYSGSGAAKGGALYVESCSPDIDNCDFDNNQASGASSQSYGGAIYANNSGATFDYCGIGTNFALNNSSSDEIYTGSGLSEYVPTYQDCGIRGGLYGDYCDCDTTPPIDGGGNYQ